MRVVSENSCRQTDGFVCVVSDYAVFEFDLHAFLPVPLANDFLKAVYFISGLAEFFP